MQMKSPSLHLEILYTLDTAVTMIEATTVKEVAIPEKWRVNRALATNEEEQTDCDKGTHYSGVISVMGAY